MRPPWIPSCHIEVADEENVAGVQLAGHLVDLHAEAERFQIGPQIGDRTEAHRRATVPFQRHRRALDQTGPGGAAGAIAIARPRRQAARERPGGAAWTRLVERAAVALGWNRGPS